MSEPKNGRPVIMSLCAAPGRIVAVEVYDGLGEEAGRSFVTWQTVIGFLIERIGTLEPTQEIGPSAGREVWAVVASRDPASDGGVQILDGQNDLINLRFRAIVPCDWPPAEDSSRVQEIGAELLRRDGSLSPWIEIGKGGGS